VQAYEDLPKSTDGQLLISSGTNHGNVPEETLESFGMLGFDWMKEHQAVLDYANRRLYFKP